MKFISVLLSISGHLQVNCLEQQQQKLIEIYFFICQFLRNAFKGPGSSWEDLYAILYKRLQETSIKSYFLASFLFSILIHSQLVVFRKLPVFSIPNFMESLTRNCLDFKFNFIMLSLSGNKKGNLFSLFFFNNDIFG